MVLKKEKSNKYLASIQEYNKPQFQSVYSRLYGALNYTRKHLLHFYGINSFDTCIDWLLKNNNEEYCKKIRVLDMAWREYITSIDCITNNIVEYHKLFFETYEKNKIYSEYNYNIWNNILTSYFIDNKSKWNTIIFHVYNIKLFSEKY